MKRKENKKNGQDGEEKVPKNNQGPEPQANIKPSEE